jgi:hypothetical protein
MHRSHVTTLVCAGALALVCPATASAQAYATLAGGAEIPTGEFAGYYNVGWIVSGRLGFPVSSGALSLGIEAFYGRNGLGSPSMQSNGFGGALFFGAFRFGDRTRTGAYLFGGLGMLAQGYDSPLVDWFPAYSFGAGLEIPTRTIGLFAETSYLGRERFSGVQLIGGVKIRLGSKD